MRNALYVDACRVILSQREGCRVSEIAGPSQDIFGAAKAFIDLAKAFDVVSMAELPADDGICQCAKGVSIFVPVQHCRPSRFLFASNLYTDFLRSAGSPAQACPAS